MADLFDFSWMHGRSIHAVMLSEPTLWLFSFDDSSGIGAECPWRLLKDGHVEISSEDHLQRYGLGASLNAGDVATDALRNLSVVSVEVKEGTSDLMLNFADGRRLEIIPFSSGYESWSVRTPSGANVIAQGGGQLSGWSDKA